MAELQHFSHECLLSSQAITGHCICSICYKDEPVEVGCSTCNFSLCKACSELPQKVSHDFHSEHPLEFCLHQYDQKPGHIICSGCGNMSSGSFYKCQECEIYLDLDCALMENIFRGWDAKELLHDSHSHLLRRSRPGPDARGSCMLCELPLSPSAICYGCVYCYSFFHDHCLDLPREILHPVHPAHPLKRLNYTRTSTWCSICREYIASAHFGCLECNLGFHLRCLDSLLRGLMHKSHPHMLIYRNNARGYLSAENQCHICMRSSVISLDSYFYCMECGLSIHFECLEIPELVVNKSHHIHPLVCKIFIPEDESLEYCGVCETVVYVGHHAYSCEECDYVGHISCILNKEVPYPFYLKDLYSCSKDNTGPTDQEDHIKSNELETKLMVNSMTGHIHVMRFVDLCELGESANCDICKTKILGIPYKCETCSFQTHNFCAELGRPFKHRVHRKHPLILLPKPPEAGVTMNCDICRNDIKEFNLFCRLCNFIIHTNCIFKGKHIFGELHRGQKIIGSWEGRCIQNKHRLIQVMVSRSHTMACAICDERVCGEVVSCLECGDIYHPLCTEVGKQRLFHHPLHPDHELRVSFVSGSECIACKLKIKKYGYHCSICKLSFHIECIKAVRLLRETKPHSHYLYQFWIDDSRVKRACCVCTRPCGMSFYGCIDCEFNAHAECIGFPSNVKNKQHQHTLALDRLAWGEFAYMSSCSLCGSGCFNESYSCKQCRVFFHISCIMSKDNLEAATEEDQLRDIYFMYIERHLLNLLGKSEY